MYDGTKEYQFLDHWIRRYFSYCLGYKNINRKSKIVVSKKNLLSFVLIDLIYKAKQSKAKQIKDVSRIN